MPFRTKDVEEGEFNLGQEILGAKLGDVITDFLGVGEFNVGRDLLRANRLLDANDVTFHLQPKLYA